MPKDEVNNEDLDLDQDNTNDQLQTQSTSDDEDEFDKAFEEASSDSPSTTDDMDNDDQLSSDDDNDSDTPDDNASNQDSTDDDDVDWKDKAQQLEAEVSQLNQKMSSWKGRITTANEAAKEAERRLAEAQQSSDQDKTKAKEKASALPDEEDEDALKDFLEEFPTLEKPIKAIARRIADNIVETKLKDIEPKLERLDTIEQSVNVNAKESHLGKISESHPDWEDIFNSGKLTSWVKTKPSFVQDSLNRVINEGTADEVIEMFSVYKDETGTTPKNSQQTQNSNGKSNTSKKAKSMEAVESGPTVIPKGKQKIDQNDFDQGWEDALK